MHHKQLAPLNLAVVGAGPVGLSLALHASRILPNVRITLLDAQAAFDPAASDPRVVALSLGSAQFFQRLGVWDALAAQLITEIEVSQHTPNGKKNRLNPLLSLRISASEEKVPFLGATMAYADITSALRRAWRCAEESSSQRLSSRYGQPVTALRALADGVEVEADTAQRFDLAVVAEGAGSGNLAQPSLAGRQAVRHDYDQTAWVGQVGFETHALSCASGVAFERFTQHGPVALLPLRSGNAALVWCTHGTTHCPVGSWSEAERVLRLNEIFSDTGASRIVSVTALAAFPLRLTAQRTLTAGRVVRIGNAAQTLHPVAGQGLNLGLRDAFELVHVLAHARNVNTALHDFEWRRAKDRWSTVAATDFLARSFTWQVRGGHSLRDLGLVMLNALGPAKSALARCMMFGAR